MTADYSKFQTNSHCELQHILRANAALLEQLLPLKRVVIINYCNRWRIFHYPWENTSPQRTVEIDCYQLYNRKKRTKNSIKTLINIRSLSAFVTSNFQTPLNFFILVLSFTDWSFPWIFMSRINKDKFGAQMVGDIVALWVIFSIKTCDK